MSLPPCWQAKSGRTPAQAPRKSPSRAIQLGLRRYRTKSEMTENTVECAVCEADPRPSSALIVQNAWSWNSRARFCARRLHIRPRFRSSAVWDECAPFRRRGGLRSAVCGLRSAVCAGSQAAGRRGATLLRLLPRLRRRPGTCRRSRPRRRHPRSSAPP